MKRGLNFNEKKIPFTVNRHFIGKVKNMKNNIVKEKINKLKMQNINYNLSVKKKNNKSFNISDCEKNNENAGDIIHKKKFSLINLRGISSNN